MTATPAPLLEVAHLSIRLGRLPQNIVDDVSFTLNAGETLCLVGESGCGKSLTALALMGLLQSPPLAIAGGTARFEGEDLLTMPPTRLRETRGGRMAMIFQEPMTSLNPAIKIGEQIAESVRRHKRVSPAAARERALEMLRRVRIPAPEKRLDEFPHQLSGGMRQRAMIAMALANDPQLLIADEPTTALDVTIQAQILELMRDLQSETGAAMIMITHDLGVVAEMADKVAVMYGGRIVEAGTTEAVFTDPQHPYTIGLMSSMPSLGDRHDRLVTVPGLVPQPAEMPSGCRFVTRCPFAAPICADVPPLQSCGEDHAVACARAPLETLAAAEMQETGT
ncbi:ATP-binding cassette domain-containing protein [Roseobacter sp. HKCCD9010]|uniref:ABC transporter ATP-binding protein n=1 Tax=unclassified Roseobacter TaxID=196798 RepID=UPI001490ABCC|nr:MULTISPECIES: ABC transporter ATP-binding protein [unclassified Roseobacter]MBF9049458.1 ATP-binding cassette domain-containing protein [Rhodobacterales bacterium HKCCD4356]NNV11458.1 ATP-binding cassette domain-containing protein [Roseobacter sp. HKCCD7357]NNV15642.1 ATP-binding cassette domain-containing protein [Roseobacter sp. HKCCD8768]NNV25102.1 ATP-binding cassette domain-containing protein [Roseobacter sp. HKCCD8192]NNV29359.1 ATP-binding cassette domain-containing protein [Roseobac